jgi:nitrile hydratase beta subunit-like protein
MIERGHHDLGGRPAGKVERDEHDYELWERRIDAMAVLLGSNKLLTVDQRRKNIEALPPEMYDGLSYYERWLMSLAQSLIERGLITSHDLATKIKEVGARSHHDMGGQPAGVVEHDEERSYSDWERRVDALMMILSGIKGAKRMITVDELRNNIERLPPDAYERMNYYDRWVSSITQTLIQRGVITTEELARKMAEVRERS